MIDWFRNRWGKQFDVIETQAAENQDDYISVLEKSGFRKTNALEKTRVFDTTLFNDFTLPDDDIVLQSMDENRNYDEQAQLRLSAWPQNWSRELDAMIRDYCRKSPIYNAKFDFVLVNKDGKHVAGCEAFIDHKNNTAEIERVCTHSDFSNRGYSQVILKSCMKRLHLNNIKTAFLSGSYDKTLHLYGKLGHIEEVCRYTYALKTR